jgi:predicted house-cleaning noncanonical NTP pyrophosphatase (MazG superfamily)
MRKTYNKLVRDNIPNIIEASGVKCTVEILSNEKYIEMIDAKLDEELTEYHKDKNIEELADLLEVIYAATVARGYTIDELEAIRTKKVKERGAFNKKILLVETIE